MNSTESEMVDYHPACIEYSVPGNDHLCFIFETDAEHRAFLSGFMNEGLKCGEKVIYVADASTREQIADYLPIRGTDARSYFASGQLSILSAHQAYLRQGVFDPDKMIGLLQTVAEQSFSEGYSGFRFTSEMSWALAGYPGSQLLIEYEARLNQLSTPGKSRLLCQYDRRRFAPSILMYAVLAHPYVAVDSAVYQNSYCGSVPTLAEAERASAALGHCLQALTRCRQTSKDSLEQSSRSRCDD
jgi:hypothetical protein